MGEAIERLRKYIERGQIIFTLERHRSKLRDRRYFSLYVIVSGDGIARQHDLEWITRDVARATGLEYSVKHGGILVEGYGDLSADLIIARLSQALFGDEYGLQRRGI